MLAQNDLRHLHIVAQHLTHDAAQIRPMRRRRFANQCVFRKLVDEGMFVAMSKITPDQVRQFGFVAAFCGGFAVSFAVAFTISRFRGRRVANASIEGLDAGYSNVGFMGQDLDGRRR